MMLYYLLLALDDGNVSLLALLDLSAAFDMIDHSILLHLLHHDFGIEDTALDWFSPYLTNCTQSVSTHLLHIRASSHLFRCSTGISPWTCPLRLYTAPLSTVIEKHSVLRHSCADDSQLQKSAPPHQIPDLFLFMQKCIDDIKSWMTLNKLRLNDNKTEAMIVSSSRKSRSLSLLPSQTL